MRFAGPLSPNVRAALERHLATAMGLFPYPHRYAPGDESPAHLVADGDGWTWAPPDRAMVGLRLAAAFATAAGDAAAAETLITAMPPGQDPPDPLPVGSVGAWFGHAFGGVRVTTGDVALTVRVAQCCWVPDGDAWICWTALVLAEDGPQGPFLTMAEDAVHWPLTSLPLNPAVSATALLQDWLQTRSDSLPDLRTLLASAVLPAPPGSWLRWYETDGVAWMNAETGSLRADTPEGPRWLSLAKLFVQGGPPGILMGWWTLREGPGDAAIVDLLEVKVLSLPIEAWGPVPDLNHPHALAARTAWRAAAAKVQRRVLALGGLPVMEDYLPAIDPLQLVTMWLADGPPPPRPVWTPLDPANPLRPGHTFVAVDVTGMDRVVAAFAVAGWQIRLSPYLNTPGVFWADTMVLVSPEGREVTVAMNDPWNPVAWGTVDGDPLRFRAFTDWVIAALTVTDNDVVLHYAPQDADDQGEDLPLTRWLLCYDRHRDDLLDWRLLPDRGGEWRYWANGIFGFDAAEQAAYQDGVATWHRFLEDVVRFTGASNGDN